MDRAAWALGSALGVLGCMDPTQVTVDISTDAFCPPHQPLSDDVVETAISVGTWSEIETKAPATVTTRCAADGDHSDIGSLVVVPSDGKDAEFAVKVVAGLGRPVSECTAPNQPGCITARRAMRFVPHTELYLPIFLSQDCAGVPCEAGSTCVDKTCVPSVIVNPALCARPGLCTLPQERTPRCGDGVVNAPGEQCDDGNTTSGDGCSSQCQYELSDHCPTATLVVGSDPLTFRGDTGMASPDMAGACGGVLSADYIFKIKAAVRGTLRASLSGTYNGNGIKTLWLHARCPDPDATDSLACQDSPSPGQPALLSYPVEAGSVQYLGVDGDSGAVGPFVLTVSVVPAR